MEYKDFASIADPITEEEYRVDGRMHYSTLAKYARTGFEGLDHLFDRVETPSLLFGSCVDALITGGQEEFDSKYIHLSFPELAPKIEALVKKLYTLYSSEHLEIESIPDSELIQLTIDEEFQLNWKPETRAKVVKEKGAYYYSLLHLAEGKTIINDTLLADINSAVTALKTHPATKYYFEEGDPFDNSIQRLYQLKFHDTHNGVDYSNMADEILVDHKNKVVIPIDLKTSSHTEYDFYKSFIDWSYHIQARLYWRNIRATMDKDEVFKDYKLLDYRFIVVNRHTLNPLVWEFPDTQKTGTLYYGKYNQIECRDPYELGEELSYYLSSRAIVPNGINLESPNNLNNWLCML